MSSSEEPTQILKYLYLGGKVHAKDKDMLQKLNITHVVNCSPPRSVDKNFGIPNYYEKEGRIKYLRVPIFDNKGEDMTPHLETVHSFISHGKHYGNVLVHCLRGVSRSASFVVGHLMADREMTLDEALAHVTMYRSVVQPNESFLLQLRKYEESLEKYRAAAEKVSRIGEDGCDDSGVGVPQVQTLQQAQAQVGMSSATTKRSVCETLGLSEQALPLSPQPLVTTSSTPRQPSEEPPTNTSTCSQEERGVEEEELLVKKKRKIEEVDCSPALVP